jgi:multidrug transporter EmrE-like cation transporter
MLTYLLHPWLLIFYAAIADCYAAYVIKLKFNEFGPVDFSNGGAVLDYAFKLLSSGMFISAISAYVIAPFLAFVALSKLELSVFYPVSIIFHMMFIVLLAVLLGEMISLHKIIGIVLIVISLFFLFKG